MFHLVSSDVSEKFQFQSDKVWGKAENSARLENKFPVVFFYTLDSDAWKLGSNVVTQIKTRENQPIKSKWKCNEPGKI